MGFLLPELSTIGYNCAPHYCFQDTQVKKQKQTKQLNPNKPSFSATISSTSNKLFWSAPEFLLTTLADTPSKKLFSQIQFRSEWSKPSTGGSKSYLPFNSFCTPNLEAKDESSANLIRIVMQALFTPPWRHSQGENWLSKLCKSRSAASMGGTEGARTTLLLLYAYTFKKKKKINRHKFFSLLEHDRFSQVLLLKISHNCPAVITLTQFWQSLPENCLIHKNCFDTMS